MKLCVTVCVFTSLIGSIHDHLLSGMLPFRIKVPVRSPTTVRNHVVIGKTQEYMHNSR